MDRGVVYREEEPGGGAGLGGKRQEMASHQVTGRVSYRVSGQSSGPRTGSEAPAWDFWSQMKLGLNLGSCYKVMAEPEDRQGEQGCEGDRRGLGGGGRSQPPPRG